MDKTTALAEEIVREILSQFDIDPDDPKWEERPWDLSIAIDYVADRLKNLDYYLERAT